MISLEPGLYVRVEQLAERAYPLPLQSGFSLETAYRAFGIYSPSETSECYFILANDRDETWFISNRHLRVVGLFPDRGDLRFSLAANAASIPASAAVGGLRAVSSVAPYSAVD